MKTNTTLDTETPRARMLKEYDKHTRAIHNLLVELQPFGISPGTLSPWFSKVRFGLFTVPFVGMVVTRPPPRPHLPFHDSVYVEKDGVKQDRDFCWWFENLSFWEVTDMEKVAEGAVAYRLTRITPTCETDIVQFHGAFGWLTDKEWKSQLQLKLWHARLPPPRVNNSGLFVWSGRLGYTLLK